MCISELIYTHTHTLTQLILVTQGHKNFALNKKRWNYDRDVQRVAAVKV